MKIPFYLLLVTGAASSCFAYTANDANKTISTDGTVTDTQAAVNYVAAKAQDDWVMTVGSAGGAYTWSTQLNVNIPHAFTIQAASSSNRATINFGGGTAFGINIGASSEKIVTLKDFIFHNNSGGPTQQTVSISGSGVCFRVTNCLFNNAPSSYQTLKIGSINSTHTVGPYGLIDHCTWTMPGPAPYNCVLVYGNGNIDHWGWTQPMTWGTQNTVAIEDCTFTVPNVPGGTIVDAYGGARILVRHCASTNFYLATHGIQSGAHDGTLQVECYNNSFFTNDTVNGMPFMVWFRGGTGVVYNNTFTQSVSQLIPRVFRFSVECASTGNWSAEHCARQLLYPADYPSSQQVGRGVVSGAEGSVPIYIWNNTIPIDSYTQRYSIGLDSGDAPFIVNGRDIYVETPMPGYTALVYPHPLVSSLSGPTNLRVTGP